MLAILAITLFRPPAPIPPEVAALLLRYKGGSVLVKRGAEAASVPREFPTFLYPDSRVLVQGTAVAYIFDGQKLHLVKEPGWAGKGESRSAFENLFDFIDAVREGRKRYVRTGIRATSPDGIASTKPELLACSSVADGTGAKIQMIYNVMSSRVSALQVSNAGDGGLKVGTPQLLYRYGASSVFIVEARSLSPEATMALDCPPMRGEPFLLRPIPSTYLDVSLQSAAGDKFEDRLAKVEALLTLGRNVEALEASYRLLGEVEDPIARREVDRVLWQQLARVKSVLADAHLPSSNQASGG